jgi:hypothetical protein
MIGNPLTGHQARHERLVQSSGMAIVEVFDGRGLPQLGGAQAGLEATRVSFGEFPIDQES